MSTFFVAVDGELIDEEYKLLQAVAVNGRVWTLEREQRITTHEVIEFLLQIKLECPSAVFIGYGMVFDFNLWLSDLTDEQLLALMEDDAPPVRFRTYSEDRKGMRYGRDVLLTHVPKKMFKCFDKRNGETLIVYDTISFWQCSFISALGKVKIPVPEHIIAGKLARGTFTKAGLETVKAYNVEECRLLLQLTLKLEELCESVGVHINQWYGPGAIAAALLHRWNVKREFYPHEESAFPKMLLEAVDCAFFGGRIENFELGTVDRVYQYDIVSAYPDAIRRLPKLLRWERWEYTSRPRTLLENSVYRVEWSIKGDIGPFPWRARNGAIYYPKQGRGWYWYPEVKAAREVYGAQIRVVEGWEAASDGVSRLGVEVPTLFEERAKRKRAGDMSEIVLKLALNSLYGKTAQRIGKAPFLCLAWAGLITSSTRARLFKAAIEAGSATLTLQTDGILSRKRIKSLERGIGNELGAWSVTEYEKALLIMSGYYVLTNGHKDEKIAKRGLETRLERQEIIKQLNATGELTGKAPRFITHAQAIHCKKAYGDARCRFLKPEDPRALRTLNPLSSPKRKYRRLPSDWSSESVRGRIAELEAVIDSAPSSLQTVGIQKVERLLAEHEYDDA